MKPSRRTVGVALVVVVLVATAVLLVDRGQPRHRYLLELPDAGQLDPGDAVRVGDRRVGTVLDLRLAKGRQALVDFDVVGDPGRLRRGTTAVVRSAPPGDGGGRHLALSLGRNDAPPLADGATIAVGPGAPTADVDEILAGLDPTARRALRQLLRGGTAALDGREPAASQALGELDPALRSGQQLLASVTRDQPALERFLGSSSQLVAALAAEQGHVSGLVDHARSASATVLDQERAVDDTLALLPQTLRHGSTTFASLRGTLDDLDPLVSAATPATKRLARLLRRLQPLARSAEPTASRLAALLRSPGGHDDLTDLLAAAPALADVTAPALEHAGTASHDARPIAAFLRPYAPDAIGGLRGLSQATAGYDANGHYARVQPLVDERALSSDPVLGPLVRRLVAALGSSATGPEDVGPARCPGTATQIRPDHSNGFRDSNGKLDCDPKAVVPGP